MIAAVSKLRRPILQRSLGLQVIGIAVLMALLGGGVVGLVVTDRARSVVRDDILSNSLATADLAAAFTAGYMGDAESATRELASRPAVQAAVQAGDFASLNVDLERWIVEHPNITVFICDLTGVTRVTGISNKSGVGQSRMDQDWFQGPMTTGQPFLGAPGLSPVSGTARVPYGVPVLDAAGAIRAVLTGSIQLDALSSAMTSISTGKNARASLTDLERGTILANVDPTRILTPESGSDSAAQHLRAGERGVLENTNRTGQHVLAAFGPVPGLPWGIMIEQPSADAFAPVDEMAAEAERLVAASVLVAVALGIVLALRIGRPLQRLRTTAEAMAGGDLDRRSGLDRQDEAGELGRAFDHMADRLQASIGRANESEAGIRAVMDSVADAILTFDAGGRIDSCNLAAERLFGYATAEVIGERIGRLVPEAALHASVTDWFATVRAGQPAASVGHECEGVRQDGTRVPLELATSETVVDGQRRLIVVARDTTERKQAEQVLRHQALHDELTGLPNRTLLQDRLGQAILAAGGESNPVTLLLVDLDRFKEINNTFGHHSGDQLLRQIGPRLRGVLQASDTVARLGGDEFGILLPGTAVADAVEVAQRLLRELEAPFEIDGQSFEIGASIGIAGYPAHGSDAAALLRQADVAMYVAKQGESGVVVYTTAQDHYSAERLALGGELRRAIEGNELLLHYQPKLDLRDGTLAGVEALVRWQHPQRGFLPPDQFIMLAEQTGLIYPLTRWVLEAALRQQRAWRAMGLDIPVAVNLSRRTLHDPQLPEMVAELLARCEVAPAGLILEITESSLMADPIRANENLAQLRALGVRMSIDDFGTGYSSLASLQNLSVDELKIDQSFVRAMATDASARAIVRAIIDLADALKLSVVAEGVEDRATWDVLAGLGCGLAQGYFLSRPIEAAKLEARIAQVGPSWLEITARPDGEEDALQERIRERGARLTAEEEFLARKQAEAALLATEERNRLALQAAGMGTWAWDVVNNLHFWSTETEVLSGLAPGAFDGSFEVFLGVMHPDDWPAFEIEERAALAERRDSITTYRVVWPDGTIRWLESKGRGLYADDGTLLRVTGTCLDITERKLAEHALRANEERFRKQYKGFPLPTYSWLQVGDDFVLQDFNDAAENTTEGRIADKIGSNASEWYPDQPEVLADMQRCVAEQRTLRREMRHRYRTTGLERELVVSYVFVPPLTVMAHIEDITDARRAEQQREAMAQSEKLRALGQMATGIAHDLNQSLMLVASYSDLARQAITEDPPNMAELEDLLTTTTQAALDGGETLKRLLLFTRAAPEQNSTRVDLSSVVRDAAQLTAPRWRDAAQAEGRPISLDIVAAGHPTIQGSAAQLRELMTNLIFNAVDALAAGGTIRLRVVAEAGLGIVEIADSGVGMSAEVQARVFEPFFTTKGEGGTGLGLAMVFGIVEQHGGRIEMISAPGNGTTFRMTFPLVDASALAEPSLAPTPQLGPLRILAVDDEPMMTKAVVRMLKPSGHVVTVASTGEEALQKLAAQTFDFVLSDMGMGSGMNGWELAEAVKHRWPGVRFLLATGWGAAIDPDEAQAKGVEAVLAKPYQLADLLRVLARTDTAA